MQLVHFALTLVWSSYETFTKKKLFWRHLDISQDAKHVVLKKIIEQISNLWILSQWHFLLSVMKNEYVIASKIIIIKNLRYLFSIEEEKKTQWNKTECQWELLFISVIFFSSFYHLHNSTCYVNIMKTNNRIATGFFILFVLWKDGDFLFINECNAIISRHNLVNLWFTQEFLSKWRF